MRYLLCMLFAACLACSAQKVTTVGEIPMASSKRLVQTTANMAVGEKWYFLCHIGLGNPNLQEVKSGCDTFYGGIEKTYHYDNEKEELWLGIIEKKEGGAVLQMFRNPSPQNPGGELRFTESCSGTLEQITTNAVIRIFMTRAGDPGKRAQHRREGPPVFFHKTAIPQ